MTTTVTAAQGVAAEDERVRPRAAVVISHPIQHFCPQFFSWSRSSQWESHVFFASSAGLRPYRDADFAAQIQWEGLDLSFPHTFLEGADTKEVSVQLDALDLERELDRCRPDVLILYGYVLTQLNRRARAWAKTRGCPVLLCADGENRQRRPLHRRAAKQLVLRRHYRSVTGFLTVGDANEDYYQSFGAAPSRFFRSPFSVDVAQLQSCLDNHETVRADVRRRLGVAESDVLVSVVGKLVSWKRQIDLIRAAEQLADAAVVVVVLGSGPDEASLKQAAGRVGKGRVIFAGFVQPAELAIHYAATDIYCHPAEREPHSLAISEAVYMGLPVVVSDRCGSYGPTDDVQPGVNGFVYRCGHVPDLVRQLAKLAGDQALRRRLGEASRAHGMWAQCRAHGEGLQAALTALDLLPGPARPTGAHERR